MFALFIIFLIFVVFGRCDRVAEKDCQEIRKRAERWKPRVSDPYTDADLIIPGLYLGNVCAAHNDSWLDENGITMVISVANEWSKLPYKGVRDVQFHYFDLDDSTLVDALYASKTFITIADIIHNERQRSNATHPTAILVHCNMGVSRSTSALMAYGQKYLKPKIGYTQMLSLVKVRRPVAKPNGLFTLILKRYDNTLSSDRDDL